MLPDFAVWVDSKAPRRCLNAPSGAGCSLTLLLGGAWLQRFQGLDRHRPCGALPAGGWSTPLLPPFVGMTPLATDGPRGGSGAGFGRDHAEKWQSDRVFRTTLMVTKTTSPAGLNPASARTCAPSPHQIPSGTGPVVEHGHHTTPPVPHRTRTKQRQATSSDSITARTE